MVVVQKSLTVSSPITQRTGLFRRSVMRSETRSTLSIIVRVETVTSVFCPSAVRFIIEEFALEQSGNNRIIIDAEQNVAAARTNFHFALAVL